MRVGIRTTPQAEAQALAADNDSVTPASLESDD